MRVVVYIFLLVSTGSLAVFFIYRGIAKKRTRIWVAGAFLLPLAIALSLLLIVKELEKFTGERKAWRTFIGNPQTKHFLSDSEPLDPAVLAEWNLLHAAYNSGDAADSIPCYFVPELEDIGIKVTRITGTRTSNNLEASLRLDFSLKEAFRGDLIIESRNKEGELLSRNAVFVHQQSPAEMSIEFRLKDFVRADGDYLILNCNVYE